MVDFEIDAEKLLTLNYGGNISFEWEIQYDLKFMNI